MRVRRAIVLLALVGACTFDRAAPPPAPAESTTPAVAAVPAGFEPTSVTWISARQGWAYGTGALLRTVDGGASWQALPAPPVGPSAVGKVRFADEKNGWLFGPELWATYDGATHWTVVSPPASPTVSLEASGSAAFAVSGGRVLTTEAGTAGWRAAGAEVVDAYASLAGRYVAGTDGAVRAVTAGVLERRGTPCPQAGTVLAAAGDVVVAVCVHGAALGSSTKSMVVSSDGARTWRPAGTPPSAGSVVGVAALSASTVLVAAASGGSWLYRTEDGGRTWNTVYTELTGGTPFTDLAFTDATHGAVVIGGRLLLTADAGRTWAEARFSP